MHNSSSIINSMITSFLGPCKSNKYVVDGKETHVVKCPHQQLQLVISSDPFSYIIESTLAAHHQKYGCSSTSLIAMWYFWNQEFQLALQMGCEVSAIVDESLNILDNVITLLSQITQNVRSLILTSDEKEKIEHSVKYYHNTKVFGASVPPSRVKTSISSTASIPAGVRYSSRHYSPFLANTNISEESDTNESNRFSENIQMKETLSTSISSFLENLSHDDTESTKLISDLWIQQISSSNNFKFNNESVIICPLILPSSYSTVVDGLLLKSKISPLYDQQEIFLENKTLIIKGSITFEYVHLGYKDNCNITLKKTAEQIKISGKDTWFKNCCDLLSKLQINILLVHGSVDTDVAIFCASHSILLISNVPWSALEIICLSVKTFPCTYLLDCDTTNIVWNLKLKKWQPDDNRIWNEELFFQVDMNFPAGYMKPYTVILCHPNPSYLACLEHQLLHLISRLNLAISNNKVLPGGGKTEEWCYQMMMKNDSKGYINSAIANGFQKYYNYVNQKIEMKRNPATDKAFDEIQSKTEAWKSALSLTMLTIQCDSMLVNDSENVEELNHDFLCYL